MTRSITGHSGLPLSSAFTPALNPNHPIGRGSTLAPESQRAHTRVKPISAALTPNSRYIQAPYRSLRLAPLQHQQLQQPHQLNQDSQSQDICDSPSSGLNFLQPLGHLKQLGMRLLETPQWPIKDIANMRGLTLFEQPLAEQLPEAITLLQQAGMDAKHCKSLCLSTSQTPPSNPNLALRLITKKGQTQPVLGAILYDRATQRLFGLAVNSQQQKKGLGSFLLACALVDVQANHGHNASLYFSTDTGRSAALKLYARAGAQSVSTKISRTDTETPRRFSLNPFYLNPFSLNHLDTLDDAFTLTEADLMPQPKHHGPEALEMQIPINTQQCRAFIKSTFSQN